MRGSSKASKAATKQSAADRSPGGIGIVKKVKQYGAVRKQPPLRVVHISNPMRVEVSPADFRGLVQELTGRHAVDWTDHPSWNNNISDFALEGTGNYRQAPLPTPDGESGTHVEVEGSVHDVDGIGCDFGLNWDLSLYDHQMLFNNFDHDDLISSFYMV